MRPRRVDFNNFYMVEFSAERTYAEMEFHLDELMYHKRMLMDIIGYGKSISNKDAIEIQKLLGNFEGIEHKIVKIIKPMKKKFNKRKFGDARKECYTQNLKMVGDRMTEKVYKRFKRRIDKLQEAYKKKQETLTKESPRAYS